LVYQHISADWNKITQHILQSIFSKRHASSCFITNAVSNSSTLMSLTIRSILVLSAYRTNLAFAQILANCLPIT